MNFVTFCDFDDVTKGRNFKLCIYSIGYNIFYVFTSFYYNLSRNKSQNIRKKPVFEKN